MKETLFYVFGIALAISAVVTSFVGLKVESFPGKAMPLVIGWFAILIVGAGTFAVLHGKDEDKEHAVEYAKAGKEIEKEQTSGPFNEEGSIGGGHESEESEAEEEPPSSGEEESEEQGEAPAAGGGDAAAGEAIFAENCAVCHGADGHGGSGGPDLRTMPLAQTEEGAIEQVTHGGGGMPEFGGTLSEEEIKNVAAYVVQDVVGAE
jgi:mono/diheme cytochrome c family protein